MKYPWLPRPRYILKGFLLLVETSLAAIIGDIADELIAIPLAAGSGLAIVEIIAYLWSLFWVIVVPIYIFAQCDRLIWHRPKTWEGSTWFPRRRSWAEGIFAYFTFVVAAGIPVVIMEIVSGTSHELTDRQATTLAIAFIAIASYVYHLGGFLWRWKQSRAKPKPARRPTSKVKPMLSKPMTDVERERREK